MADINLIKAFILYTQWPSVSTGVHLAAAVGYLHPMLWFGVGCFADKIVYQQLTLVTIISLYRFRYPFCFYTLFSTRSLNIKAESYRQRVAHDQTIYAYFGRFRVHRQSWIWSIVSNVCNSVFYWGKMGLHFPRRFNRLLHWPRIGCQKYISFEILIYEQLMTGVLRRGG